MPQPTAVVPFQTTCGKYRPLSAPVQARWSDGQKVHSHWYENRSLTMLQTLCMALCTMGVTVEDCQNASLHAGFSEKLYRLRAIACAFQSTVTWRPRQRLPILQRTVFWRQENGFDACLHLIGDEGAHRQ
jgi:hypothetical protein